MGNVHTVCTRCVPTLQRMRVESRVFYPMILQRSCHVQQSTCKQNVAIHSMFNIQEFQAAFPPLYCTVSKCIFIRKVQTVCIRCVPTLHRMRVESRVFYQEFQAGFSPLYCTVSKFIFHGKSADSVHTVCSYIAQNAR